MAAQVFVAGVGVAPFKKPKESDPYDEMGEAAARAALIDAGLDYSEIQQAYAGYTIGDSTYGQSALYRVGLTGIPIFNVNNACATGSSALYLARQAVAAGTVDVALAVGFEQMRSGALGANFDDRKTPMGKHIKTTLQLQGFSADAPPNAQFFGGAGIEHQTKYGTSPEAFGQISVKARAHAANNDLALFRTPLTIEEVMGSPHIFGPLTRLQCCPPTCGAAAAVLVSASFARKKGLTGAVPILAQSLTTDTADSFSEGMMNVVGYDASRKAALEVYEASGIAPEDVRVVELHDCFTANELITYEALGLCTVGDAERFIRDGDNTYGGRVVTNPSGGLLSKGHPLGATGLAQCAELVWQLRGQAGRRQVDGLQHALQHNIGLGSACVVTMYGAPQ